MTTPTPQDARHDGGQAFPSHRASATPIPGMTLRDYFAGQAMAGMMSDSGCNPTRHHTAKDSYLLADAMLAERAKASGKQ